MSQTKAGEAMPNSYLVTVIETYRVEAEDEATAVAEVKDLRPSTRADTVDVQVERVEQ